MSYTVNKVTHEVTLVMDDMEVKLRASFERLAEFQRRLDVDGYVQALMLLQRMDPRAVLAGLVALSGAPSGAAFEALCAPRHLSAAAQAVTACLTEGMPETEPDPGNGETPAL